MSVSYTRKVEAYLNGAWANLTSDLVDILTVSYGIEGSGPTDCVAGTGVMKFQLRNSAASSGGVVGYYSPGNAAVRSGWKSGVLCRLTYTYSGTDYVKFYGKIIEIRPVPGSTGRRTVDVVAYDFMRDLAEADVREVSLETDKSESELITSLLAALPAATQPLSTSIDTGVDTYTWAFDNLGSGVKALSLIKDIAVSALAFVVMKGNGTFRVINRHNRNIASAAAGFVDTDGTILELDVPSSLQNVYNHVRVTIHQKDVDPTPTTILAEQSGVIQIPVDGIVEVWASFTDESNRDRPIGGYNAVSPLVANTDYTANSASDGSGTDMTADLVAETDIFASGVSFTLANVGAVTMYVTHLQIRGQGVYDNAPRTFNADSVQDYGDRPLDINLPYQDDAGIGQATATYIEALYNTLLNRIDSLGFLGSDSNALMLQAMLREPGDKISVTESVTGLSASAAFIQKVDIEDRPGDILVCRWNLAPASPFNFWQLGVVGASELGVSTVLGF